MIGDLKETHQRIERKVSTYDKHSGRESKLVLGAILVAFLMTALLDRMGIAIQLRWPVSPLTLAVSLAYILLFALFLVGVREGKIASREYGCPTPEERMFRKVYNILNDVSYYSQHKDDNRARVRASTNLRKIIEWMEENPSLWTIGSLGLASNTLGKPLEAFRNSLDQHLLPFLEKGDEGQLPVGIETLEWLAAYLANPQLNTLGAFNLVASKLPMTPRTRPPTLLSRVGGYPRLVDCFAILVILAVVGAVSYFASSLGIEMGTLYLGSITLFGILLGAYFKWLRPRKPIYAPSESAPVTVTVPQPNADNGEL